MDRQCFVGGLRRNPQNDKEYTNLLTSSGVQMMYGDEADSYVSSAQSAQLSSELMGHLPKRGY
jgi:hypothetical protein